MEQRPSREVNSHPPTQNICRLLRNPTTFHCRVHNSPPLIYMYFLVPHESGLIEYPRCHTTGHLNERFHIISTQQIKCSQHEIFQNQNAKRQCTKGTEHQVCEMSSVLKAKQ
jgi:hypothetical protein